MPGSVRAARLRRMTGTVHTYRTTLAWEGSTGAGLRRLRPDAHRQRSPGRRTAHPGLRPGVQGRPVTAEPRAAPRAGCVVLPAALVPRGGRSGPHRCRRVSGRGGGGHARRRSADAHHPHRAATGHHRRSATDGGTRPTSASGTCCEVAHRECYVANSLRTEVVVEPTFAVRSDTVGRGLGSDRRWPRRSDPATSKGSTPAAYQGRGAQRVRPLLDERASSSRSGRRPGTASVDAATVTCCPASSRSTTCATSDATCGGSETRRRRRPVVDRAAQS